MNVVHVYDGHERIYEGQGSLPRIVLNVASRTAARGHDVTVLERQWDGLAATDEYDGVRFRRLNLRTGADVPWERVPYDLVSDFAGLGRLTVDRMNFALNALRVLRAQEFDVVHVYLPFAANVIATVAPRLRRRLVYTAQLGELRLNALTTTDGSEVDVPGALQYFSPDVYLAKRVAKTTVLNRTVKRIFEENGVPGEKLVHVPNGVDVEMFGDVGAADRERVRETYGLEDRRVVFFAGTVMPRKGVAQLVEATGRVVNGGREDVHLVIAGETGLDEEYTARVESLVAAAGIEDNVTFTGYLDDDELVPMYELAEVFVLPSFEEGFGMVVSEAMAAGTPVIGSRISGIDQQIDDGTTGVLVEPGAVDELATALSDVLDDPAKRRAMGERSRERARRFSWEAVTDQYVDVYESVARRTRSPRAAPVADSR